MVAASSGPAEAGVVLLHDRADGVVETVYGGLASIRVGVGIRCGAGIRSARCQIAGHSIFACGARPCWPFKRCRVRTRPCRRPGFAPADRIAPPPAGEALEPGALKLQEAPAKAK